MTTLVVDIETQWSYKEVVKNGKSRMVSDKGSPFSGTNAVVCVGIYNCDDGIYSCYDFRDSGFTDSVANALSIATVLVGHNIKFDIHHLRGAGLIESPVKPHIVDTMVNEYTLRKGDNVGLGLNALCVEYFGEGKDDLPKRYWEAGINTDEIPRSILHSYLKGDVMNTYKLYLHQKEWINVE